MPNAPFAVAWDLLLLLLLLHASLSLPFRAAFWWGPLSALAPLGAAEAHAQVAPWLQLDVAADAVLCLDVALRLCLFAHEQRGELVTAPRAIAARYARGWLWLDLPASLPLQLALASRHDRRLLTLWRLPRLLRLLHMRSYLRAADRALRMARLPLSSSATRLLAFLLVMLALNHWVGCAWRGSSVQAPRVPPSPLAD